MQQITAICTHFMDRWYLLALFGLRVLSLACKRLVTPIDHIQAAKSDAFLPGLGSYYSIHRAALKPSLSLIELLYACLLESMGQAFLMRSLLLLIRECIVSGANCVEHVFGSCSDLRTARKTDRIVKCKAWSVPAHFV